MATYTMPLRAYIEHWSQDEFGLSTRERIEIGRPKLFDFHYPFFDEEYKKVFETNFIRHFYMREIGYETEGLFKMMLEDWLNINMPYFNRMFESELIEFDPLLNSQMTVEHTKKNDKEQTDDRNLTGTTESDGTVNSTTNQKTDENIEDDNFNRDVSADTPDDRLALTTQDGSGILEYASFISENTENNKRNRDVEMDSTTQDTTSLDTSVNQNDKLKSNVNELEDFIQNRVGKIGVQSYSKMIQEYRDSFLRIEKTIFDEMRVLFMGVYS